MNVASALRSLAPGSTSARPIYLDAAATTKMDSRVLEAVIATLSDEQVGNSQATFHSQGQRAHQLINRARVAIGDAICCHGDELIFTSGATEANNLALQGLAPYLRSVGKTHIITSAVEHKSILAPLHFLEANGFTVTILPVKPCGMIEAKSIENAITDSTGLVSIQAVNNEIGTIQPLTEIAAILKGRDILFHTDAAQALGKKIFSVVEDVVDFASLSAHKMHGPQGIGTLYVRKGRRKFLSPLLYGGGQEGRLRSGTLPTALCVGFGKACELLETNPYYLQNLRDAFLTQIAQLNPIVHGHSDPIWNVPGILNIRFSGVDSESIIMALPNLAIGTGASCTQNGTTTSHVIKAITNSEAAAQEALRLSFDRMTTQRDIDEAASQFAASITNIREIQGANK